MEEIKNGVIYQPVTMRAAFEFLNACKSAGIVWAHGAPVKATREELRYIWRNKKTGFFVVKSFFEGKKMFVCDPEKETGKKVVKLGENKKIYFTKDEKDAIKNALRVVFELQKETGEKAGNIPAAVIETILNKLDN